MTSFAPRPELGPARPFRFPPFERHRSDVGPAVIGCHLPGRPIGAAVLLIDAGALHEPPEHGGVAGLAAGALREGTGTRDSAAFAEAIERLGARLFTWSDWDDYGVLVTAPVEHLSGAISLMAEAVLQPAFPTGGVERLRSERLNHLKQMRAQSTLRAHLAFPPVVLDPAGPYARDADGEEQTVAALSEREVRAHHERLASPGAATLIVTGDLDGFDAVAEGRAAFGSWSTPEASRSPGTPSPRSGGTRLVLIDRPGSVQSDLIVGHASVERASPAHTALELGVSVLGGMFNSRLMLSLREEKGYTYGVSASLDAMRLGGTFSIGSAVQTPHTAASVQMIVDEVRRLCEGGVTAEELDASRDYLTGVFPLRNETARQIALLLAEQVTNGLPDDEWDRVHTARAALTPAGVGDALAEHLRPDDLAIVVVGDAEQVAEPLRSLGLGPVEVEQD